MSSAKLTLKKLFRIGNHSSGDKKPARDGEESDEEEVEKKFHAEPLTMKVIHDYSEPFRLTCLDYDKYQGILCCGTSDGRVYLFGRSECEFIMYLQPKELRIEKVILPTNSGILLGYGTFKDEAYICCWKLSNLQLMYRLRLKRKVALLCEKRNMMAFVFEDNRKEIRFFNHKTRQMCDYVITVPQNVTCLTIMKNIVVTGCSDGTLFTFTLNPEAHPQKKHVIVTKSADGKATVCTGYLSKFAPKKKGHGAVRFVQFLKKDDHHFLAMFESGFAIVFVYPTALTPMMKISFFQTLMQKESVEVSGICVSGTQKVCVSVKRKTGGSEGEMKKVPGKEKSGDGQAMKFFGMYSLEFLGKRNKVKSCKLARKYCENCDISRICALTPTGDHEEHTIAIVTTKGRLKFMNLRNGFFINMSMRLNAANEGVDGVSVVDAPQHVVRHCFKAEKPKKFVLPFGGIMPEFSIDKTSEFCLVRSKDASLKLFAINCFVGRKKLLYNLYSKQSTQQKIVGHCFWSPELLVVSELVGKLSFINVHSGKVTQLLFQIPKEFDELLQLKKPKVVHFHVCAFFNKAIYVFSDASILICDLLTNHTTHFTHTLAAPKKKHAEQDEPVNVINATVSYHHGSLVILAMDSTGHCHHYDINGTLYESFKVFKKKQPIVYMEMISQNGEPTMRPGLLKLPPHITKMNMEKTKNPKQFLLANTAHNSLVKKYKLNAKEYCIEVSISKKFELFDGQFEIRFYDNHPDEEILLKLMFGDQGVRLGYFEEKKVVVKEAKSPVKEPTSPTKKKGDGAKKDGGGEAAKVVEAKTEFVKGKWVEKSCDKIATASTLMNNDKFYLCYKPGSGFEVFDHEKKVNYALACKRALFRGFSLSNCRVDVDAVPRHLTKDFATKRAYLNFFFKEINVYVNTNQLQSLGRHPCVTIDFFNRFVHNMKYLVCASPKRMKVFQFKAKKKVFRKKEEKKFKDSISSCTFGFRGDLSYYAVSTWKSAKIELLSFPDLDLCGEASFEDLRIPFPSSVAFSSDGKRVIACGPDTFTDLAVLKRNEAVEVMTPSFFNPKIHKPKKKAVGIWGTLMGRNKKEFVDGFTLNQFRSMCTEVETGQFLEVLNVEKDREEELRQRLEKNFEDSKLSPESRQRIMEKVLKMNRKEKMSRLIGDPTENAIKRSASENANEEVLGSAVGDMADTMNVVSQTYAKMLQHYENLKKTEEKTKLLSDTAKKFAETAEKLRH